MAQRATSLGPKPAFVFMFFFFFVFFWGEGLRVRRGGLKGHLTWHLNPAYLFSFFLIENLVFPLKGHFWEFFSVSLLLVLSLFGPPPFTFSFSVSLSLSLYLFRFFLPSFLSFFLFSFGSLFLSLPLVYYLLLFHEKNYIKIFNYKIVLHQSFLSWGFLSSFLSDALSLSLFFS